MEETGRAPRWMSREVLYGQVVEDPYRWLEEPSHSPTVMRWLAAQRRLFVQHRSGWPLLRNLRDRIEHALDGGVWSPPKVRGARLFTTHQPARTDHPRLLVIEADLARVLVDVLAVDPDGTTTLDRWEPSPAGHQVAVQTSRFGTEPSCLVVIDAASGEVVDGPINGLRYSPIAWIDEGAFYYVRGGNVWFHRVSSTTADDRLVLPGATSGAVLPDVRLYHGRWLVAGHSYGSGQRRDLWLADVASQAPESPVFMEVQVGRDIDTDVLVGPEGRLYLRTTDNAPRRRLCVADQPAPDVANWRELISERADATLERVALVDAELLACWSRRGISELTAHDPATGSLLRRVELPGKGRIIKATMEQEGDRLHFAYSEVSRSPAVLTYDRARAVIEPGLGGLSEPRAQVQWHRSLVTAADGTEVPVTVLSTASIATGPLPTILHVYGSYGRTRDFGFSATVLAWLQAGGQYAVAHVRGGGEHGASWHRAGSRAGKLTATADLVAVGEWLHTSGYATPEQTCLSGGSAGGVLVLSAAVRRPELWGAVIAVAPLADMIRYERFGIGRLWTKEFGTVTDSCDFAALLNLSPYHRVQAQEGACYPAVLLCGFDGDTRTGPEHPRKMCAALQWANTGARPVLLRYETDVGHSARATSREIDLAADAHAFAAAWTGLGNPDHHHPV